MAKRTKPYRPTEPSRAPQPVDAAASARARRLMLLLLLNSVVILTLYFVLNALNFWPIFFIYMGAAAVLILVYVIYNKGFVYKNATPDMLPSTIPVEERMRIIEAEKQRMDRSRWMLTLIFPLVVAFLVDALYLFLLSDLFAMIGIV